jgi:FlaA1/EpsC-like NDP-sugar epimerase
MDHSLLLNRDPIEVDLTDCKEIIQDQRVLITGGAGSIGSELVRQVFSLSPSLLIVFDNSESSLFSIEQEIKDLNPDLPVKFIIGDVKNSDRVEEIFDNYHPQLIFHVAAYKHVPMMESNPIEAIKTNIEGTIILANKAIKYKTERFVFVSTDKAVNPSSIMGATKRISEMYVKALNNETKKTKFIITRFGNVLGSVGSVIPTFINRIESGKTIFVTHPETTRYFMTIPEASKLILKAVTLGKGGEIFMFDMGKPIKIVDIANRLLSIMNKTSKIEFSGLRPGEKLHEDLLYDREKVIPTLDDRIVIANEGSIEMKEIKSSIDKLLNIKRNDIISIVECIKEILPEYKRLSL